MDKIAVIGNSDFVMPFSALGLDTFAVTGAGQSVTDTAQQILDLKYKLVVVAENIARQAEEVFSSVQNETLPCVLVVPFTAESTGFATESLSYTLKMATGINILKDN